ncbi:MAG: phage tail protein, partial [Sphingobium phenoxybenzoativorans]
GGEDVRGAIAPVMDSRGWAVRETAGGLAAGGLAVDGGVEADGAIDAAMFAARLNGRAAVPVQRARTPAEAVPVRLALRHYDPARDYQAGMQKAVRPGPGRREASVDLPEAMAAGAARTLAHDRLAAQWAARRRLALTCGWEALVHAPGDIVTVEGAPGRWRIAETEWEAMGVRLTLEGQAGGSAGMLPASGGAGVSQPDLPHGATVLMLADLPVLSDAPPAAPVVVAAAAGESEGWRRAALFTVTPGTGQAVAAGGTAPAAAMGMVAAATGDGSAMLFDMTTMIEVEMLADGMTLHPADDAALINGANLCLVGRELIQFGSAVQTGPRRFRLSRLLRGRRGTEWATGGHGAGELLLMIEQDRLAAVADDAVHVGAALSMLAIGIGDAVPAEATLMVTGEALIPLPPVHVAQEPDGAGGVTVRWVRRSRAGWRWLDGVDAPLGEESERYALRLMDGGVTVRSAETAAPLWTYSAAMIAADAAAGHGGPLRLDIRQAGAQAVGRAASVMLGI